MKKESWLFRPLPWKRGMIYWTDIPYVCDIALRLCGIRLEKQISFLGEWGPLLVFLVPYLLLLLPLWDLWKRAFPREEPQTPEEEEQRDRFRLSFYMRIALLIVTCLLLVWMFTGKYSRFRFQ